MAMASVPREVVWARRLIVVATPIMVLATVGLLFSDRAPGAMEPIAEALRVDDQVRGGIFGYSPFTVGHLLLWAALSWLLLVSTGRRERLLPGAAVIAAVSVSVELLQVVATSVRSFQVSDVIANCIGIGLGAALAALTLTILERRAGVG